MKKILVISFTDLSKDPRVKRQIIFLKDKYEVTCVGLKSPEIEGVSFINCGRISRTKKEKLKDIFLLLSKNFEKYYWSSPHIKTCTENLKNLDVDIIIANDIDSLPLALCISNGSKTKIIFDAHEYAPKEFEDVLYWRILFQRYKEYLCKKYICRSDAMMTVSEGISKEYEKNYGMPSIVVNNSPEYKEITPRKVDERNIKIIFHGGANPSRKIENMIKMMDYLNENYTLDLMILGNENYIRKLNKICKSNNKIKFIDPIPMDKVCDFISKYDIGLYILEPNSFNNNMALPNKLFEFIQARLMIAIGPSPEMSKIVLENDCGVVADNFSPESLAKKIECLSSEKINYYKNKSDLVARRLCAQENKKIVLNLVNGLLE